MTLLIVVVVALVLYVVLAYNGMIKLRNRVKEAWSDIDVQLKRRYNLIPNIIETVKGYAAHEEGVFIKVTEARAQAINATGVQEQGAAENMLSGALKSLFAVAENYPDLKANENFMQLQNELVDTEDKIQSARRFHNSVVKDFNTKIQQFPAKIIAQIFKFKDEEFFEADEEEKENVEVDFSKDEKAEPAPAPAVATDSESSSEEEKPAEEAPAEPETEEVPAEKEKAEEPTPEPEAPAAEPTLEEPKEEPVPETPAEGAEPVEATEEADPEPAVSSEPVEAAAEEEKPVEEAPAEPAPEEPKEEEKPAEPEAPAEEKPAEGSEPVKTAEEAPAEPKEEDKPAEDSDQAEMPLEGEEKKDA